MWGWSESIAGWSQEQVDLLKSSWRPSTQRTYQVAWRRWLEWTKRNNVNYKKPDVSEVAKFLADLYLVNKLSYNSILLHKSVVSTLCDVNIAERISSHPLVKHILKAVSLKRPIAHKPPIWNIDVLASYLNNYTIDENNYFQVSRHAAILLVLCSGRRIHDLTLLNINSNHCTKNDDFIIFWPIFGSKTDSEKYRQSGWKLLSNQDNHNLNPVYWINRVITLLQNRRKLAKCDSLFVSIRGQPKAASRAIIAGWIKTILQDANIIAAPGSIRSAVASKNWYNNVSMEEILARGNWKSINTFTKYYKRQVVSASPTSSITDLFHPI